MINSTAYVLSYRYIALLCLLLAGSIPPCLAAKPKYELQTIGKNGGDVVVRVVSATTHKVIWSRKVSDVESAWSSDHRHLALSYEDDQGNVLALWTAGRRVRTIHHLPYSSPYAKEFRTSDIMDGEGPPYSLAWSPDAQRLLFFWAFSQGPPSVGEGAVCVLNTHTLSVQFVFPSAIEPASWIGRRKIRFRTYWGAPERGRTVRTTVR